MSEANQQQTQPKLTSEQKETARRLGMSEKDYGEKAAELIRRGKLRPENIR